MGHGAYASAGRWANLGLGVLDHLLSCLRRTASPAAVPPPGRLLLASTGHLGDVVLATAVLPVLRRAFPACSIGFLIGSWARPILERHPLVRWLHTFDHGKLNRRAPTLFGKICRHLQTRRQALRDIRAVGYDTAIDLRYYFANAIPILWQAGIPVRIGSTGGGFGPLLTHPVPWRLRQCHVVDYLAELVAELPVEAKDLAALTPTLPPDPQPLHVPEQLQRLWHRREPYVVFHMGSGAAFKEWPGQNWRALAERLTQQGWTLVLTGSTRAEDAAAERVGLGLRGCLKVCGKLNWAQFVAVLRRARLVLGVDSVAGHVAAAVGTPCIVLGNGITHAAHWRPRSPDSRVLLHPVACAPCYRSRGCAEMECVRHITVADAWQSIRMTLSAKTPAAA